MSIEYIVLQNKDELIGVDLIITEFSWPQPGYCEIRLLTVDGRRLLIGDSRGIQRQLKKLLARHPNTKQVRCKKGLRKSSSGYFLDDGGNLPEGPV